MMCESSDWPAVVGIVAFFALLGWLFYLASKE